MNVLPRPPQGISLLFVLVPLAAPVAAAPLPEAKLAEIRHMATADDPNGALPALVTALGVDDPRGRLTAALSIAALADRAPADDDTDGPDFTPAVKALIPLVSADDPALLRAVATALGTIGPVGDDDLVDDAVDALGRAASRVTDAETRAGCLVALADYGPASRGAVPTVARFLRAKTPLVRETAAATLAAIGPEARGATGELARLLGDDHPLVRAAAAAALAAIGPDARDSTPVLASALSDADPMVRGATARALAAIGPDAAPAIGAIVAALSHENDGDVALGLVDACGEIGPGAIPSAATLVGLLSSADAEMREAAAGALGALGAAAAQTAAAPLEKLLDDADPFVRVAAAGARIGVGRHGARERGVLVAALRADDEELQAAAAEVIGDWGDGASGFTAELARVAVSAKDPQTRVAAIAAIGDIAATDSGVDQADALGRALDDDDADVRHAAAYAIAEIPAAAAALEKAVVAAADDDDVRVRMEIAPVLARLGTPEARRALEGLADDDDESVAEVAKEALGAGAAAGR